MTCKILLVEDDPDVRLVVADLLRAEGHAISEAGDGSAALAAIGAGAFDLLILDVMLPAGIDGFEVCHTARENGFDGAILMLTARSHVDDRVNGLHTGADDYLVKPFEPNELLARVGALLRRIRKAALKPVKQFRFGAVEVDFNEGEVRRDGAKVNLASKELALLRFLIDRRGQVVTREQLLSTVWSQQPFITPRTVDTHIAWLRQKLEADPQAPKHILTVRGEGYIFES